MSQQSGISIEDFEEVEDAKSRNIETKTKRGGKALRRIKTFLRREKKYVVMEGGSSSQRSRTRSV